MLVLDATVLINFGGVGALDVLYQSGTARLVVVDEVVAEVRHQPAASELQRALKSGRVILHHPSSQDEVRWVADLQRRFRQGAGETASLAVCLANGWDFASDDLAARRMATMIGGDQPLKITGTVGLLVGAVRGKKIDLVTAETLYQGMIEKGFRAPFARLADLFESQSG